MRDRKTESDIKSIKAFLEFWTKFHSIYAGIISKSIISDADESTFLETKETIRAKYEGVKGALDITYMPHSRLTDPVDDILSLSSVRFVSEKRLKKLDDDWRDSYVFLNSILERLEQKKRRADRYNPVSAFLKRFVESR